MVMSTREFAKECGQFFDTRGLQEKLSDNLNEALDNMVKLGNLLPHGEAWGLCYSAIVSLQSALGKSDNLIARFSK